MGIFSALSGKIRHFNSINTPIDNELAHRIKELDDSIGKIALLASFDVAQNTILQIFHPDNGILKNYILKLDKDGLRKIWHIIITYVIWQVVKNKDETEKTDIILKTALALGIDEHKLELSFIFFKDKKQNEQLIMLWHIICNQIQPNLDDEKNLFEFSKLFTDIYNKLFF